MEGLHNSASQTSAKCQHAALNGCVEHLKRQTVENSQKKWPSAERERAKINIEKSGI